MKLRSSQRLNYENHDTYRSLLWPPREKTLLAECKIFSVSQTIAESQSAPHKQAKFYTLSCSPWVNVIALTAGNSVLMVEQYRHGVAGITLEIPGGCIDEEDADPLAGGRGHAG